MEAGARSLLLLSLTNLIKLLRVIVFSGVNCESDSDLGAGT